MRTPGKTPTRGTSIRGKHVNQKAAPAAEATEPGATKSSRGKAAASYILSAPKGPRTVSHRQIERAVDKVFRDRTHSDA